MRGRAIIRRLAVLCASMGLGWEGKRRVSRCARQNGAQAVIAGCDARVVSDGGMLCGRPRRAARQGEWVSRL